MLVRFALQAAVLAGLVAAGWWARGSVARPPERPYTPRPDGYEIDVVDEGGLIFWQRFRTRESRDDAARSWSFPGFAVLVTDPGSNEHAVVYGDDLLELWECVFPLDLYRRR